MENLVEKETFDLTKEEHLTEEQKVKMREAFETKTDAPTEEELAILRDPELFKRINHEFDKTIKGEVENRKALFLHANKRLVRNIEHPDALIVNAESSAGKDYVTKKVSEFFPKEFVDSTRLSPTAIKYWRTNEKNFSWDGRLLIVVDASEKLMNSEDFKLFLSDSTKAVTTNRDNRGTNDAAEYETKGKPITVITTAESNPNNEAMNRSTILPLDESQEQTKAIIKTKLRRAAGLEEENAKYDQVFMSAYQKLSRVEVVIPFAEKLEKHLPTDTRSRRDIGKYLNYIKSSAALFQYQRKRDERGRVIAEAQDYETARKAIERIQTGSFVSLTRGLKKTLEAAQKWSETHDTSFLANWFSVKDLWTASPIYSEKQLYTNLETLAEKKIVEVSQDTRPPSKKPITVYKARPTTELKSVILPKFEDLGKTSFDSNNSIDGQASIVDFTSNDSIHSINTENPEQLKEMKQL